MHGLEDNILIIANIVWTTNCLASNLYVFHGEQLTGCMFGVALELFGCITALDRVLTIS